MDFTSSLQNYIDRFLTPIDDPGSRLFHVNLLMTIVFIFVWVVYNSPKNPFKSFTKLIWRKKYWWNHSTKIDYQIYILNSILKGFLFIPYLDFSYRFSKSTIQFFQYTLSTDYLHLRATHLNMFLFTVFAFVVDDFLRFAHHWLMHNVSFLWKFHQTHHSARILTPISLFRTHPVESAMSTVRNSLSTGLAIGGFIFLFDGNFSLYTLFGVNFFGFVFNFLASNLRHSHIQLSFGIFEKIFISPFQHQIHHSTHPDHFNKNYGVSLAIWDTLTNTLLVSQQVQQKLKFGLSHQHRQSLKNLIFRLK